MAASATGKVERSRPMDLMWQGGRITSSSHLPPSAPHGDTCSIAMTALPGSPAVLDVHLSVRSVLTMTVSLFLKVNGGGCRNC